MKIKSIDIVYNKVLEDAFEAKRAEFKSKKIPSHEVMAFHGTPAANIPSILKSNLQYLVSLMRLLLLYDEKQVSLDKFVRVFGDPSR